MVQHTKHWLTLVCALSAVSSQRIVNHDCNLYLTLIKRFYWPKVHRTWSNWPRFCWHKRWSKRFWEKIDQCFDCPGNWKISAVQSVTLYVIVSQWWLLLSPKFDSQELIFSKCCIFSFHVRMKTLVNASKFNRLQKTYWITALDQWSTGLILALTLTSLS